MTATGPLIASRVLVTGSVPGFERFVDGLASELGLSGRVGEGVRGLEIHVEGGERRCSAFLGRLRREAPEEVRITGIQVARCAPVGLRKFVSDAPSPPAGARLALRPDLAICVDCEASLSDPDSRRFRHPFVRCDACGPRHAVAIPGWEPGDALPGFFPCDACGAERGRAAQSGGGAIGPGCPRCGPEISVVDRSGRRVARGEEALRAVQLTLEAGDIAAVKGVSGFHLMVRADDTAAVAELRRRAACGDRPFPVLFSDQLALRSGLGAAVVSRRELDEMSSPAAPIVLVRPPGGQLRGGISAEVAPHAPDLGCMLASSPLQRLLLAGIEAPVVAWDGASDGGPPAADLEEARRMFGGVADLFLDHEVSIAHATPDSIVRVVEGERVVLRAGKGLAPRWIDGETLLGLGPERAAVDLALGSPGSGAIALREGHRVLLPRPSATSARRGSWRRERSGISSRRRGGPRAAWSRTGRRPPLAPARARRSDDQRAAAGGAAFGAALDAGMGAPRRARLGGVRRRRAERQLGL